MRPQKKDFKSDIEKALYQLSLELDDKHDRYERIVKLSRDITIESKRIIFLLHTIDKCKNNANAVLTEADTRINRVIKNHFQKIAEELINQDPYQYRQAYSAGLQEFIEAYTFAQFLKWTYSTDANIEMTNWSKLQNEEMTYSKGSEETSDCQSFQLLVDPTEFILGVADFTGELMRRCINSIGSGDTDNCFVVSNTLKLTYAGFLSLSVYRRELSRKMNTMRQSVLKAENVCYNIKVRGNEAAKWGAIHDTKPLDDIDEGIF